jgi:hypothetical protein
MEKYLKHTTTTSLNIGSNSTSETESIFKQDIVNEQIICVTNDSSFRVHGFLHDTQLSHVDSD